jgi:YHS domain-containing protein
MVDAGVGQRAATFIKIYATMQKTLLLAGFILTMAFSAVAQKSEIFSTSDGAVRGYDVVAYFKQDKAVKGDAQYAYTWKDAKWLFASQANLDLFKASPEQYAPQYGGYCAYGTSQGHKAPTDPQTWTVLDGKLYLNYNPSVKTMWVKDKPGYIAKADKNWPALKDKE